MKALVTCEQSKALDLATRETLALSALQLMEKASLRLWDALRERLARHADIAAKGKTLKIIALCGKGDNGGDALAIIRHAFCAGYQCLEAVVSAREPGECAKKQAESLAAAGIRIVKWKGAEDKAVVSMLANADIVLDGILGTGLSDAATNEAKEMIECLLAIQRSQAGPIVVSIDLPSGLGDEWKEEYPCVRADITLCLEPAKAVCYLPRARILCGDLVTVTDIFPESLFQDKPMISRIEARDIESFVDAIPAESYKMSRGRLAVFAGSKGAIGAARLCAKAAAAAGAGYVTLYVDEAVYAVFARSLDSIIVKSIGDIPDLSATDMILAGPGWGKDGSRADLLRQLLETGKPAILDADALRILALHPEIAAIIKAPCALTPHPGELASLAETASISPMAADSVNADTFEGMKKLCLRYASLIVAKSHVTWIVSPNRMEVWEGMTPELGTAGSGDVLAGIFAGLAAGKIARLEHGNASKIAEDLPIWKALEEAAICAVAAHGMAGKQLAERKGWFEASELISECSLLLHKCV